MNNFIKITHLTINSMDNILLPSMLYTSKKINNTLAIFIHGAGSSSIVRRPALTNNLALSLNKKNIDFLTFNNRGAGYMTKFDNTNGTTYLGGMAFERISDFHYDICGIISWAKKKGYNKILLIGHSTGANKIVYELSHYKQPLIVGTCLIGGGDDITLQRGRYSDFEISQLEKKIDNATKNAKGKELVSQGVFKGEHPMSWDSLKEIITPNSDYDMFPFARYDKENVKKSFQGISKIVVPTLIMYGSNDFGTIIPPKDAIKLLKSINDKFSVHLFYRADHNLTGRERDLSACIAEWFFNLEI